MNRRRINIGLVIPESGPSGIFGPSCSASAQLAIEDLNNCGGILGREVVATTIDGGAEPEMVATTVRRQVDAGALDAIVGWHTSAVRTALTRELRGRVPHVYTAVYEGGESGNGLFMTGEVPESQLVPALRWMSSEQQVTSWFVVGSDYIWPRGTVARMCKHFRRRPGTPRETGRFRFDEVHFTPLGTTDFGWVLDRLECSTAGGVLVLLLGNDAVHFNREFAARGLHDAFVRLSPLMDENMLLATGSDAARRCYSVSGFFESLVTSHSMDFESRYMKRFGSCAPPLTSPGESCYEGIGLLSQLAARSGSLTVDALDARTDDPFCYESPRGRVRFARRHLVQDVYLAEASGLDFDVVARVAGPS